MSEAATPSAPSAEVSAPSNTQTVTNQPPQQGESNNRQNMPTGNGQSGQSGQKSDAPSPSSKPQQELYELTVDGKTRKVTLEELKAHASMAHAATARFQEASKLRKEYEAFKESAQKDMIEALRAQGFSNQQIQDQFERWYTKEFIEPETLTPEQRKLKEYEVKLQKYQQEEQEKLQKQQQEEQENLTAKQREYLSGQIVEALEKSGLPKTKLIASRMAFYMRENLLQGWEAPIDVIVQQVKQERQALMAGEVGSLDGEDLIRYLGDDVVDKIRKWDLMQLRARRQNLGSGSLQPNGMPANEKVSSAEVTRRLREIREGKR